MAYRAGLGPSVVTAVLIASAFAFFYAAPIFSFAISDLQNLLGLSVMLIVATVTSGLAGKLREQAAIAAQRQHEAVILYRLTEDFSNAQSVEEALGLVPRHFKEAFGAAAFVIIPKTQAVPELGDTPDDRMEVNFPWDTAFVNRLLAGEGNPEGYWRDALGTGYHLLMGTQGPLGVLMTETNFNPTTMGVEGNLFVANFQNQVAHHIERLQLAEERQRVQMQIESESIRNSLLSAISHDLRTPLTRILGAASALVEGKPHLSESSKDEFSLQIQDEARHMADLMNKVLEMARLSHGDIRINHDWNDLEEIVGSSISRLEPSLADCDLRLCIESNLPLIWVDAVLIQQVIVNLVENALKYSPSGSPIRLSAHLQSSGCLLVEVAYRGPGIAASDRVRIFKKFSRLEPESTMTGVGLGLFTLPNHYGAPLRRIGCQSQVGRGGGLLSRFLRTRCTQS